MAGLKKMKFIIPVSIVCLVLAFAVTWQFKGIIKIKTIDNNAASTLQTLQSELKDERQKREAMMTQILQQKDEIEKFRTEASKSSDYSKILSEQLERAEMLAGLTDVEGEGLIVTLNDKLKTQNDSDFAIDPNLGLIHDDSILRVINELRASGAEAISLNDERILSTSEVRCTGPTVTVNKNRYTTPFVIRAIGNAQTMENSLKMTNGAKDWVEFYGATIDIKKSTKVTIKRYTGPYSIEFANPVKKEAAE